MQSVVATVSADVRFVTLEVDESGGGAGGDNWHSLKPDILAIIKLPVREQFGYRCY